MQLNPKPNKKALSSLSKDVGEKRRLKQKEEALKDFVSQTPIKIEYGCHTIQLKYKGYGGTDGFSFYATRVEDDGTLVLRTC